MALRRDWWTAVWGVLCSRAVMSGMLESDAVRTADGKIELRVWVRL